MPDEHKTLTREEVRDQLQQVLEVLDGMNAMLSLEVTNQQVLEVVRDELDEVLREVLPAAVQLLSDDHHQATTAPSSSDASEPCEAVLPG